MHQRTLWVRKEETSMKKILCLILLGMLPCILLFSACTLQDAKTQTEPPAHIHSFGDWRTLREATCAEEGERERLCDCGKRESEAIPTLPHTEVIDEASPASCKNEGKTEGKHCTVCKTVTVPQEPVPVLPHTVVTEPAVPASCEGEGKTEKKTCSVCLSVLQESVPVKALGHAYDSVVTPPTRGEDGYTTHTCTRCHHRYTDSVTPALGFTDLAYRIGADGTSCTVTGRGAVTSDRIVIPETLDGYTVTAVASRAFYGSSVQSVTIPSSVTQIGEKAFYGCHALTSVTFRGSSEKWEAVEKGSLWGSLGGGCVIRCEDRDLDPEDPTLVPPAEESFENPAPAPVSPTDLPLICDTEEVINVLLLASDARRNEMGRSDVMILVSINARTKKIVLCSFMRDTWALFPNSPQSPSAGEYDKLTHAHVYGGPELTMAVFKEAFNIEVHHYVKVKFASFAKIVDALGGLNMNLSREEAEYINQKCWDPEISAMFPDYDRSPLTEADGVQTLNGPQVLCHMRNRTISWDWARTQRQRDALVQMFSQASSLSFFRLCRLADTLLPLVETNLPADLLTKLVSHSFHYAKYEVESTRFPQNYDFHESYEGTYHIVPDLQKNCTALYKRIFGTDPVTAAPLA